MKQISLHWTVLAICTNVLAGQYQYWRNLDSHKYKYVGRKMPHNWALQNGRINLKKARYYKCDDCNAKFALYWDGVQFGLIDFGHSGGWEKSANHKNCKQALMEAVLK